MALVYSKVDPPVGYLTIAGTWGWDDNDAHFQWWEQGSPFTNHLASLGLQLHLQPFEWATNLDGLLFERNLTIWKAAGKHLKCHIEKLPLDQRNVVAHSHGGNVLFWAAAYGARFNNVITVGTPVRWDMEQTILMARPNLGYWHHIYDSKRDWVALMGAWWDGRIRIRHQFDWADSQDDIYGICHSKVLTCDADIQRWGPMGWAARLAYGRNATTSR